MITKDEQIKATRTSMTSTSSESSYSSPTNQRKMQWFFCSCCWMLVIPQIVITIWLQKHIPGIATQFTSEELDLQGTREMLPSAADGSRQTNEERLGLLRSSSAPTDTTGMASSSLSSSQNTVVRKGFSPPKVVILPGPHKAASSSLQSCMTQWTQNWKADEDRKGETPVLQNWSWPIPSQSEMIRVNLTFPGPMKGFASLMAVANDDDFMTRSNEPLALSQSKEIIEVFQAAMANAWQNNYKIVFGSEEFDQVSHPQNKKNATEIVDTILEILPWERNIHKLLSINAAGTTLPKSMQQSSLKQDDVHALIVYRSPRIDHLRSLWHQVSSHSFKEFLLAPPGENDDSLLKSANAIDSLALAHRFAEHNILTTVVDMNGIQALANSTKPTTSPGIKTNLCHVVSCEVLGDVDCTKNTQIASIVDKATNVTNERDLWNIDVSLQRRNEKSDAKSIGLTTQQMAEIEVVMQEYDCGFRDMLASRDNFQILHQHSLFVNCNKSSPPRTLAWMLDEIRMIAERTDNDT